MYLNEKGEISLACRTVNPGLEGAVSVADWGRPLDGVRQEQYLYRQETPLTWPADAWDVDSRSP